MYVVMPAYNEAPVIGAVLAQLTQRVSPSRVIVVNDGSADATGAIAQECGVHVVHHRINRGLGAALKTGLTLAHELGAQVVVTYDADGQHDSQDVARVAAPIIENSVDMVIGSRFLQSGQMPWTRRVFNWIGNVVTWVFHGAWVSDSQSGLRAFSRDTLGRLHISANHMDVSSEFVREVHRLNLNIQEVPIKPVYTEYSLSKGQSLGGGFRTVAKIALRKFL